MLSFYSSNGWGGNKTRTYGVAQCICGNLVFLVLVDLFSYCREQIRSGEFTIIPEVELLKHLPTCRIEGLSGKYYRQDKHQKTAFKAQIKWWFTKNN